MHEATVHQVAMHQATGQASAAESAGGVAAGLVGGAVVLLVVLVLLVGALIRLYRSECHQLRLRNRQLSIENDRWHEDFAAQTGELSALRRYRGTNPVDCQARAQARPHADAS